MNTSSFQELIWDFYKNHKRNFPWRETTNPYFIFISEICLQQTQTSRVVEKYVEITEKFPHVELLATAPFSEILKVWSGLGYNRRAQYLHQSAKIISNKYQGVFPQSVSELDELPGVGVNTAAAIAVYAFNTPHVFIETNIRRIFIHHFFEGREAVPDSEIFPLIEKTLDYKNPREWYWALMDYGSYLPKVVKNPNQKSKHYVKQSKFEGSVRQVRGSILKIIMHKPQTKQSLVKHLVGDKKHIDIALKGLIRDGLLLQKGDRYSLQ